MSLQPVSADEVAEALRQAQGGQTPFAARGGGTKPALIGDGEVIEMRGVAGITEYEASEYTFTARAGTTISEVRAALREKGQYLPFDPLFVEGGATLGGTVAAGTSGPGRFRYGGLRDFLIGVQFVDGHGKLVRSGGKVVKNAAGFDLPKFLVGSVGRFGILTEVSFKVFPAPVATLTLRVECDCTAQGVERIARVASSRWEADALEFDAGAGELWIRLGGPSEALASLAAEIEAEWPRQVHRCEAEAAESFWRAVGELSAVGDDCAVVKVPLSPTQVTGLDARLSELTGEVRRWYSNGGAVGWLALESGRLDELSGVLDQCGLEGLVVRGETAGRLWAGRRAATRIVTAVKEALDPEGRFPAF